MASVTGSLTAAREADRGGGLFPGRWSLSPWAMYLLSSRAARRAGAGFLLVRLAPIALVRLRAAAGGARRGSLGLLPAGPRALAGAPNAAGVAAARSPMLPARRAGRWLPVT